MIYYLDENFFLIVDCLNGRVVGFSDIFYVPKQDGFIEFISTNQIKCVMSIVPDVDYYVAEANNNRIYILKDITLFALSHKKKIARIA